MPGLHPKAGAEQIITEITRELGDQIAPEAVVIGSTAATLALGTDFGRGPRDLDVIVPPKAVEYLSALPGSEWETSFLPNGTKLLRKGRLEVGSNDGTWPPTSDLMQRGWKTHGGLHVAGLSDVYSWKEGQRGNLERLPKDSTDQDSIRRRLHNPDLPPLPESVMPTEMELAWSMLPEKLHEHQDAKSAARLIANALLTVFTLYGDPRIDRINRIVGDLELPECGALATYHSGFDLVQNGIRLQQHFDNITGISARQRLIGAIAESYSDAVYGNGRKRDQIPGGHDELRSAELAREHTQSVGFDDSVAQGVYAAIRGTEFDEASGTQAGWNSNDPVVRGVTGVDLQPLVEPESVEIAYDLAVENDTSRRWNKARTLGRVLAEHGVVIRSTAEALAFIGEHPNARPSDRPDGPTIMESLIAQIFGSADFRDPQVKFGYQPVPGWTLDNLEARAKHAATLRRAGHAMKSGMTALQAYNAARELR